MQRIQMECGLNALISFLSKHSHAGLKLHSGRKRLFLE